MHPKKKVQTEGKMPERNKYNLSILSLKDKPD
jgi:hypothetical protein